MKDTEQRRSGSSASRVKAADSQKEPALDSDDLLSNLEATLDEVAETNPGIERSLSSDHTDEDSLKALLQVSLAVSSSLVLENVLQLVMHKAIELMQAERGLIMLLDKKGELQVKAAFNLDSKQIVSEDFKISKSIAHEVARTGRSVYTSDAQQDVRFAQQQSVIELHLRSIMCVPLLEQGEVSGVIYLDNSSEARMFLKSDLYLFELYAQQVSKALHNAHNYEAMRRLQGFNESILRNSPVGIIVLDSVGHIMTINPMALQIFDFDREKVKAGPGGEGTLFLDTLPDHEQGRWRSLINIVLTTKNEVSEPRFYHNTRYLEKVLSLKISPLANLPDSGDGLVMAMEDITEKVTMEQYVILSEKLVARGEMAASVAHELNNYLSIIANNAELMGINIDRESYDKVKFNAKSITDNIFKIKRFAENLMDFSQPVPEYISYDVKHLIDDLLFSLRIQPRFKLVHFTIDLRDSIPNIEIDVGQIQQVLLNLLNNASDAIEEKATQWGGDPAEFKREIGIKAAYHDKLERVVVEICDRGTGMTEEVLAKIFSLHFTTKRGGHGLGLYNCRVIAEQHGGELQAASVLGESTTFTLILPRFQQRKPTEKQ